MTLRVPYYVLHNTVPGTSTTEGGYHSCQQPQLSPPLSKSRWIATEQGARGRATSNISTSASTRRRWHITWPSTRTRRTSARFVPALVLWGRRHAAYVESARAQGSGTSSWSS